MESLVRLLAISLGHTPSEDGEIGLLEARIVLNGLVRVLQDEDLMLEIADRLCQSRYGNWENQDAPTRNECIYNALEVMDALRDIIAEDLNPGGS